MNPSWKAFAEEAFATGTQPRTNPDGDVDLQGKSYDGFRVPKCKTCEGVVSSDTSLSFVSSSSPRASLTIHFGPFFGSDETQRRLLRRVHRGGGQVASVSHPSFPARSSSLDSPSPSRSPFRPQSQNCRLRLPAPHPRHLARDLLRVQVSPARRHAHSSQSLSLTTFQAHLPSSSPSCHFPSSPLFPAFLPPASSLGTE